MKYEATIRVFDRDKLDGESVIGINDYIHENGFFSNQIHSAISKAMKYIFNKLSDEPIVIIDVFLTEKYGRQKPWCIKHIIINQ